MLTKKLAESLRSGRYEGSEASALKRNLRPEDWFLDLEAGAGYLVAITAGIVGGAAVTGVEATPEMVTVAEANLDRNGGVPGRIAWGAVVPDGLSAPETEFNARRAFWASSIAASDAVSVATRIVPALRLGALLAQHRPTVLSIDFEGGELRLFDAALPDDLRLVVLEFHPTFCGSAGVKRLFDRLSASGLAYSPEGSHGATVVFERVRA